MRTVQEKRNRTTRQALPSLSLDPWTEVVGTVAEVKRGGVVLKCQRLVRIDCSSRILTKYGGLLRKGNIIAVLATDSEKKIRLVTRL